MKIVHRISFSTDQKLRRELSLLGFEVNEGFITLEINEEDSRWQAMSSFAKKNKFADIVETKFTNSELFEAEWLVMEPTWHNGYPLPDDDFGYLNVTYDLSSYCSECGIGAVQKHPFHVKGEPKWGTKQIMQLNWVFEEFFVKPSLWKDVFQDFGIEYIPVIQHNSGKVLNDVVQLKLENVTCYDCCLDNHLFSVCSKCSGKKYHPFVRGKFPSFESYSDEYPFKTKEFFGSGALASRVIIIPKKLFLRLAEKRVRGIRFTPVENRVLGA